MNNLKPGRQLDSLIAENVMGWIPGECNGFVYEYFNGWICDECGTTGQWGEQGIHEKQPKAYSTDIAAAWEVVERLRLQRTSFCIEQHHNAEEPTVWFINENNMKPGMVPVESMETCSATASTVPYAICLAALKAIANNED